MKLSDKILSIRLGAIYRMAVERRMGREIVEALLSSRASMSASEAKTLAAHWFTTWHFRQITRT